ncbi:GNAT family N-acetyltransferase [Streptomyces sp. NPDC053427]|uniref:GNAT family N-acetyltransferase n=1 Tax=Streptomyces sp. NPDC053427 TaxID=3365701 RepID=UPI0037D5C8FC
MRVRSDSEHLVAPVVKSLAEAYAHPDVAGDGKGTDIRSGMWRLAIAADEQGRGYGRFAVESVDAEVRRGGGTRFTVTWHPGDGPEAFSLGLGFRPTEEKSGKEAVGERELGRAVGGYRRFKGAG